MGFTVRDNTPSAGYIAWSGVHISYKGQVYAVSDGNTNKRYVWWDYSDPYRFQTTDTLPTLTDDDVLVFFNKNGIHLTVPTATVVDGSLIVPESIMANAIAANTITGDKIAANTISADNMAANAVGAEVIVAGAIGTDHLAAGAVTADKVAANAIGAVAIAAGAITTEKLAANAVTSEKIYAGAVTAEKLGAGAVTAEKIAADAVTADKINVNELSAISSNIGTITAGSIGVGVDLPVVQMGVDEHCTALFHFDGSLNSHKGVAAIGDANFDTGCFGQAVKIEEGTTNLLINPGFENDKTGWVTSPGITGIDLWEVVTSSKWQGNKALRLTGTGTHVWRGGCQIISSPAVGSTYTASVIAKCDPGVTYGVHVRIRKSTDGGASWSTPTGCDVETKNTDWTRISVSYTVESGVNAVLMEFYSSTGNQSSMNVYVDGCQFEQKPYPTSFVDGTRLGVLKAPTTGLSASQGTISFRAKNLAESANGSVLVDLPKSDNTQGLRAGIANDGKLYIADSDKVSRSYTETSQADFQSGTLTDVVATSAGDLELAKKPGAVNLLTANQSSIETDTTGLYSQYGATITRDTTEHWNGSASLKVVTPGTRNYEGFEARKTGMTLVVGDKYTASAWVKGTGTVVISLAEDGSAFGVTHGSPVTLTNAWQRITVTRTITNAANTRLRLFVWTSTTQAVTFYADGLQLEKNDFASPWTLGGTISPDSYEPIGTRIKEVNISGANPAGGTKIEWSATTPTETSIKVETALSLDGGSTYGTWQEATNGGSIPGITTETDLSNARLKIRQTLSTTDTSKTPQLHSLSFSILESAGTVVYGPDKSTLIGWDSISLAWKPDRLSLVVNDEEACYIKNPSLPASLGSHIFIGTDRNGNNAINTLVDELRIDKVYREVNIRTGWHKTDVPFYTSEDMKQWPGYLKLETDGIKVYDPNDALRVLLGSWLSGAIRKYGLQIIGGEIYASYFTTREPGQTGVASVDIEPRGSITIYDYDGDPGISLWGGSGQGMITWYFGGIRYAQAFINAGTDKDLILWTREPNSGFGFFTKNGVSFDIGSGGTKEIEASGVDFINLVSTSIIRLDATNAIFLDGETSVSGDTTVYGEITATGGKPASQPTENYGIRKIYAVESPELKYYDSGVANLQNGEATIYIDPIFLECIEPDTELTPWQIWVECYGENGVYVSEVGPDYFKVKERNGGTSNNKVVWRLEATRINYAGIRLMEAVNYDERRDS